MIGLVDLPVAEAVIERGLQTFWEVGTALLQIRDRVVGTAPIGANWRT